MLDELSIVNDIRITNLFIIFLGSIYWSYIYITAAGNKKRDKIGKYTRTDRVLQMLFLQMTLIVTVLNLLLLGDLKFIE